VKLGLSSEEENRLRVLPRQIYGPSRVRFPIRSFQPHCGLGVDSVSNRSEYQELSWGVKGGRLAHKADNLIAIC
jgi:hypothetical protein